MRAKYVSQKHEPRTSPKAAPARLARAESLPCGGPRAKAIPFQAPTAARPLSRRRTPRFAAHPQWFVAAHCSPAVAHRTHRCLPLLAAHPPLLATTHSGSQLTTARHSRVDQIAPCASTGCVPAFLRERSQWKRRLSAFNSPRFRRQPSWPGRQDGGYNPLQAWLRRGQ